MGEIALDRLMAIEMHPFFDLVSRSVGSDGRTVQFAASRRLMFGHIPDYVVSIDSMLLRGARLLAEVETRDSLSVSPPRLSLSGAY